MDHSTDNRNTEIGNKSVDAAVDNFSKLSDHCNTMVKQCADFTKYSMETTADAYHQMMQVRSMDKLFEVQSNLLKASYDNLMAHTAKMASLYQGAGQDGVDAAKNGAQAMNAVAMRTNGQVKQATQGVRAGA